jgi:hypothetical protein
MELKVSRRRFGQLVIAGTATGAIGYLANKTSAQTSDQLYAALPNYKTGLLYVYDQSGANPISVALLAGERLTGFTFLANNTRVLSLSPALGGKKKDDITRLVLISGTSQTVRNVSGLKKNETLESLVGLQDGSLVGLVLKKNGRPPVQLVDIDITSGALSKGNKIKLPQTERFSGLAEGPNQTIYSTAVGRKGNTSLVQLDLEKKKPSVLAELTLDNQVWTSGFRSLTYSPGGEILALGARRYEIPNNVYRINPSNGAMTVRVAKWNVAKIAAPLA